MPRNPNFQPRSRTLDKISSLSIYVQDNWNFYSADDLEFKTTGPYTYAILKYRTGLIRENETNPANVVHAGDPGDYIFVDNSGFYSIIKRRDIGKYVQIPPPVRNSRTRRRRI